jgi:hypothetical protein
VTPRKAAAPAEASATGAARAGTRADATIAPAEDVSTELARLDPKRFNVLSPVLSVESGAVSPVLVTSIQFITIDPVEKHGDVYHDPRFAAWNSDPKKAHYALTAQGIGKIGAAAGVKWIPDQTGMVPGSRERRPNGHVYLRFRATAALRQPNGEWYWETAEVEIDTEDEAEDFEATYRRQVREGRNVYKSGPKQGKPRFHEEDIPEMVRREVLQLRKFIIRHAETKAKSRVIRRLLSLGQVFDHDAISRPFAVPRLLYRPEFADPLELERVQIEGRRAERAIFGPGAALPARSSLAGSRETSGAGVESGPEGATPARTGGPAEATASERAGASGEASAAPTANKLEDPAIEDGRRFSDLAVNDRAVLEEIAKASTSPKRRALAKHWLEHAGQAAAPDEELSPEYIPGVDGPAEEETLWPEPDVGKGKRPSMKGH